MDEPHNICSLETIIMQLRTVANNRSSFLSLVCELSDAKNNNELAIALARLQQEDKIHIEHLLSSLTREDADVWRLTRLLVRALAETDIAPQNFLETIQSAVILHKDFLSLPDLGNSISTYCERHENSGIALIAICLDVEKDEDRGALLSSALIGLSKSNPTVGHAKSLILSREADVVAAKAANFSLGVFDYKGNSELLRRTESRFVALLHDAPSPTIRASVALAISRLLQSVPSEVLSDAFIQLSRETAPEISLMVVKELWISFSTHHTEMWHQQGVCAILDRPTSTPAELDAFDHLIWEMLSSQPERAIECLERWALAQHKTTDVKRLDSIASQLRRNHQLLCRCITRWFNSDCRILQALATFLVQYYTEHSIDSTVTPLQLDAQELMKMTVCDVRFVLGKIVGYCFPFEKALVPLVFSALQKTDSQDDVDRIVISFFIPIIAYDYPGATQQLLNNVDGERQKKVATIIKTGSSRYFEPLTQLPALRECQLSEVNHQKLLSARHAHDAQIMKKVEESSILKHIASTFMVKNGRSFFSKFHYESMTGQEPKFDTPTPFVCHSISAEIPRRSMLDPIGMEWQIRSLRAEQRIGGNQ